MACVSGFKATPSASYIVTQSPGSFSFQLCGYYLVVCKGAETKRCVCCHSSKEIHISVGCDVIFKSGYANGCDKRTNELDTTFGGKNLSKPKPFRDDGKAFVA